MSITETLSREDYALVVSSGIRTQRDLAAILPPDVAAQIEDGGAELLGEMTSQAALRVLATIRNANWHRFIGLYRIDWDGMLNTWARRELSTYDSVLLRVEAAASLDRWTGAAPDLFYLCRALDRENFLAVIDAVRIVVDGGLKP